MKKMSLSVLALVFAMCHVGMAVFAHDDERISFATVKSTERAKAILHEEGLRTFMDEVWAQGVTAPGIHSKYWLDQFTRGKPDLHAIEKAYRDFGYEVAVQIENLAFEIYEKPDKSLETDRLDWLLRFSKWMLKPGRFENYRIGMRTEGAALMPLHRTIFNLDVSTAEIERYMARFSTTRENAVLRAAFLYEESGGVFDVRDLALRAKAGEDDGFESEWIKHVRRAYKHFGGQIFYYTTDPEILRDEKIEYSFFMDDNCEFGGWDSVPEKWDEKYHRHIGVFGGYAYAVRAFYDVMIFRKDIGEFPDVEVPPGQDGDCVYGKYYHKKYRELTKAQTMTVGWLYWEYKNNMFMDSSTDSSYRSRNHKKLTRERFESRPSTKRRRARNQQWLKKHGKAK